MEESQKNLNKYLKTNRKLEDQNESLKTLWEDLQKQNEAKGEKIHSLQKLNRSLSLLLSQNKKQTKAIISPKNKKFAFSNQMENKEKSGENLQESFNHVLADIHFD